MSLRRPPIPNCRKWSHTQLQPSFKGVPFAVEHDSIRVGRRLVIHEYPSREFWDVEDLGRAAVLISVDGKLVGDRADSLSHLLQQACSSPAPGLLVLPNRQPVLASCLTCDSDWVEDAMGKMPFHAEFVAQSGQQGGIVSLVLLAGTLRDAATVAANAVVDVFTDRFNSVMKRFSPVQPVPAVARDAAVITIRMAADALNAALRQTRMADAADASRVEGNARYIKSFAVNMAYQGVYSYRLEDEVFIDDQFTASSSFGRRFATAAHLLKASATDHADVAESLRVNLMAFEAQPIESPFDVLSVKAERALTQEVQTFVRRVGAVHWLEAAARADYDSRRDAVSIRALIATTAEETLAGMDDPVLYKAVHRARNAAVEYLTRSTIELPPIVNVETARGLPAAVLATILYNDATRDRELMKRNKAAHPLYMPHAIEAVRPSNVL